MSTDKNIKFKKSLGQNFIFDKNLLAAICSDAGITPGDAVLEIGAGAGTLTAQIAERAASVIAVEIDRDLKPVLDKALCGFNNAEIVFADVLKLSHDEIRQLTGGQEFKLVANLPYYITTPVIFHFLESDLKISSMTVMVQKEVAERIAAKPGSKAYGAPSLSVQARCDVFITRTVGRSAFIPVPDVDSAVIRLDVKRPFDPVLSKVIKGLFGMRRKTVLNNLCAAFALSRESALDILCAAGIPPESRGEQLGLAETKRIAGQLQKIIGLR